VTYPFAGYGGASLWILLELLILYWFARDVFYRLGRRRFWRTLLTVTVLAGVAAWSVELVTRLVSPAGADPGRSPSCRGSAPSWPSPSPPSPP
jgi:membrane associated rhomboid family serine protease